LPRASSSSSSKIPRRGRVATRRASFALAVLACLCVTRRAKSAEKGTARGEGTAEKKTIVLTAEEKGWERGPPLKVILRGGVRIEYDGLRLEAAGAVYNDKTGDVYAEGPVRLFDDSRGATLTCKRLSYNLRTHHGRSEEARLVVKLPREPGATGRIERGEVSTAVVEADVITREGPDRFVAHDAIVTSCGFADPHWHLRSRRVEVDLGDALRARGNTLYLGDVPVFRLPRYSMDISEEALHLNLNLRGGAGGRWGYHFRVKVGVPVVRSDTYSLGLDQWGLGLGWRQKRGWETGAELRWRGHAARGGVVFDTFFENDTEWSEDVARALTYRAGVATKTVVAAPPTLTASAYLASARGDPVLDAASAAGVALDEFRYAGEPRHYLKAAHNATLPGGWEMEARVHSGSDRDVREEYHERDAKTGIPDVSFLDLRRRTPGQILSIYTNFHVDRFRTETEYLPEVRWTVPATALGAGLLLSAEASSGYLRKRYDEIFDYASVSATDYDAFRAGTRLVVSRPFRLGPIRFSPYVGTDQAYYAYDDADRAFADRGIAPDSEVSRGAAVYGGAVSTRIFGNLRAGERPLRHVIELRADYLGVSDPTHDPAELIGFDLADDLMETNRLRFAVDQRMQTKVELPGGARRSHDIAGLLLGAELYADDLEAGLLNSGRDWGPLAAEAFVSPSVHFRMFGGMDWDVNESAIRTSYTGVDFGTVLGLMDDPERDYWRATFSHVASRSEGALSSELGASVRIYPQGRWSMELQGRYEFEHARGGPGWTDQSLGLVRDFHDFDLSIRLWRDPQKDDSGVSFSIRPKGYPVNLPLERP
jgi:hypothetical protein